MMGPLYSLELIRAWLIRHGRWLLLAVGLLAGALVVRTCYYAQQVAAVLDAPGPPLLTKKEQKQLQTAVAAEQRKRAVAEVVAAVAAVTADSAVAVAVRHDQTADSAVRVLVEVLREGNAPADTVPLTAIEQRLNAYRPQAHAVPGLIDSLR